MRKHTVRKHTVRKQTRKNRKVRGGGKSVSPSSRIRSKSKSQMKKVLKAKELGLNTEEFEVADKNAKVMEYNSYFDLRNIFEDALEKLEKSGKSLEELGLKDDTLIRAKDSVTLQYNYHMGMVDLIIKTAKKLDKK